MSIKTCMDRCENIPIVGELPSLLIDTPFHVWDTVVGMLKTPFSHQGPYDVQTALDEFSASISALCLSLIKLNPYHKEIGEVGHTNSSRCREMIHNSCANTDSGILKRVYILTGLPTLLVARVVDLALGIIALGFAIVTLGMHEGLNTFTNSHLTNGLEMISDLPTAALQLIRPPSSGY